MAQTFRSQARLLQAIKSDEQWVARIEGEMSSKLQGLFRGAMYETLSEMEKAGYIPADPDGVIGKLMFRSFDDLDDEVAKIISTSSYQAYLAGVEGAHTNLTEAGISTQYMKTGLVRYDGGEVEPSAPGAFDPTDPSTWGDVSDEEDDDDDDPYDALDKIQNLGSTGGPTMQGQIIQSQFEFSAAPISYSTNQRMKWAAHQIAFPIMQKGYQEGVGIDEVARRLKVEFPELAKWESKRLARTTTHQASQWGANQTIQKHSEYKQWWTADDTQVRGLNPRDRADHRKMHGEICRVSEPFSNGLMHPGDWTGSPEEAINCRCRVLPFVIPRGYGPPTGRIHFRESDLVELVPDDLDGLTPEELDLEINTFCSRYGFDEQKMREVLGDKEAYELSQKMQEFANNNDEAMRRIGREMGHKVGNMHSVTKYGVARDNVRAEWQAVVKGSYDAAYTSALKSGMTPDRARAVAKNMIDNWAQSSSSGGGMGMSRALEQLGLTKGETFRAYGQGGETRWLEWLAREGITQEDMQQIVYRDYVRNQVLLNEYGVSSTSKVKLFRGQHSDIDYQTHPDGYSFSVFKPKGVDSFSTSSGQAQAFGGSTYKAEIPVNKIFACDLTNQSFWENEVLWLYDKKVYADAGNFGKDYMVLKKLKLGIDLSWDILMAAFNRRSWEIGRHLNDEEKQIIVEEVSRRLDAGENQLDLLDEYGAR